MIVEPFHDLSPAEQERLAVLSEECSEVIQIVNKIWRHGYESTHPDDPDGDTNRDMLQKELGHVEAAKTMMISACDIGTLRIAQSKRRKLKTIQVYLHHQ